MKHIALAASFVMLMLVTAASAAPAPGAPAEGRATPAFALMQPLHGVPDPDTEAAELQPSVELASYFTFMRSFGRICYSMAVGYYYC